MVMNKGEMILMLLASAALAASGQVLFKLGLLGSHIYLVLGLASYLTSTIAYLYVLSKAHLSWVYGVSGLSYLFAGVLAAVLIPGEQISALRWLGIGVIAMGAAIVGSS